MSVASRHLVKQALDTYSKSIAASTNATQRKVLTDLIVSAFSELSDGRVLISTTEGGGGVTFAIPDGYDKTAIVAMAQEIINEIDGKPSKHRMRVSFAKAAI